MVHQDLLLRFNSVGVEIRGLRPEVIAGDDEVSVHYRSRTNMRRRLSTEILAQVDRRTREQMVVRAKHPLELALRLGGFTMRE